MERIGKSVRIYKSSSARRSAMKQMTKWGVNYFVLFADKRGPALQFSNVKWLQPGQTYVSR